MKALLVFFTGLVMATSQANASNDPSFPMTEFHPRFDSIESTISSLFEDTTLKYKTANVMIAIILYMGWVIFSSKYWFYLKAEHPLTLIFLLHSCFDYPCSSEEASTCQPAWKCPGDFWCYRPVESALALWIQSSIKLVEYSFIAKNIFSKGNKRYEINEFYI